MRLYYRQRTIITKETNFIRTLTAIAHIYRLYTINMFHLATFPRNIVWAVELNQNTTTTGEYGMRWCAWSALPELLIKNTILRKCFLLYSMFVIREWCAVSSILYNELFLMTIIIIIIAQHLWCLWFSWCPWFSWCSWRPSCSWCSWYSWRLGSLWYSW